MHRYVAVALLGLAVCACSGRALAQSHIRTPLNSDGAISVYVGMQATWQSLTDQPPPPVTCEKAADVAEYALTATPTVENFDDHIMVLSPLPDDPAWYGFRPAGDTYHLTFDIADSQRRLGRIVVSDLATGFVCGSLNACGDGSSITGRIEADWSQAYFRIDGYSKNHTLLFILGASSGRPDTYVHFTRAGEFAPHRPSTVVTPRFGGCSDVVGTEGDPYSPTGVRVCTVLGVEWFSRGCCGRDHVNDTSASVPVEPAVPFLNYIKLKCIEIPERYERFLSNEKADQPRLADAIVAAAQQNLDRALTAYVTPPYSDVTVHWNAKFMGRVTAFFVVPYTVAKHNDLWHAIGAVFCTLTVLTQASRDKLAYALIDKFTQWLTSDAGKQSGLKAGMVIPVGDVKTVDTREDTKSHTYLAPLYQTVTFVLAPDVPPASGFGNATPAAQGAWTTPPPPGPQPSPLLSFSSSAQPPWSVTAQLPKGYKWTLTGSVLSPVGYVAGEAVQIQTPVSGPVTIPCRLNALLQLKVYTRSPNGPASATVTVKKDGGVFCSGTSSLQPDGQYAIVFTTPPLALGTYVIEATSTFYQPANPLTIGVVPALSREETMVLGPPRPPVPPR